MKKVKCAVIMAVLIVIVAFCLAATEVSSKPKYEIRKVDQQAVLYTIYRGDYQNIGQPIGKLFALAGTKGIIPAGQVQFVYLNNPNYVSKEHWLTEIRIPVGKEALKLAGTLGEITDIKVLPASEMIVAKKPKGQADPNSIYANMYKWIYENNHTGLDSPVEIILSGSMAGDYSQMESEIMMPVKKMEQPKK